jgi:hypothetical protein
VYSTKKKEHGNRKKDGKKGVKVRKDMEGWGEGRKGMVGRTGIGG